MNWRIGIIVVFATIVAIVVVGLRPPAGWTSFGFGSDWRCQWVARGEPICIRQITGASPSASTVSPTGVSAPPTRRP